MHRVQQPFCSVEGEDFRGFVDAAQTEGGHLRQQPTAALRATLGFPQRRGSRRIIPLPGRIVEEPEEGAARLVACYKYPSAVVCTLLGAATIKDLPRFVTEKSFRAFSNRKSEFYFPELGADPRTPGTKCLGMASAHAPRASSSALPSSGPTKGGSASGPMPSRFDASFDRLTHTFGIEPTGAGDTKVSRRAG